MSALDSTSEQLAAEHAEKAREKGQRKEIA